MIHSPKRPDLVGNSILGHVFPYGRSHLGNVGQTVLREETLTTDFDGDQAHDFVIIGSGAGGGPLAANLALEGYRVLLIEAGGDKINDNYSVPAFHARASEDPNTSWEFFAHHYSVNENRDPKYQTKDENYPESPGIFYPRASALGGCTAHHAMITVYPAESDWNAIADEVGDASWNADNMRKYFDRIEQAQYRDGSVLLNLLRPPLDMFRSALSYLTGDETGAGARGPRGAGWLTVSQADPLLLLDDVHGLLKIVKAAFETAWDHGLRPMPGLNPNDPSVAKGSLEGVNVIPISVDTGKRTGARERVLQAKTLLDAQRAQGREAGRLDIETNTFATEIVFSDDDPTRAVGVRCVRKVGLYNARPHGIPPGPVVYRATKEVILCGGAFNTPQLLMLSGIGPRADLESLGIEVRVERPGVGKNLQDRYEVGVVARAAKPFRLFGPATFGGSDSDPGDILKQWRETGRGFYATNGAVLGIIKRSSTRKKTDAPDLFIFGLPLDFRGYRIDYSLEAAKYDDHFTWAVLKGHTDNRSGYVKLKSKNPFDTPEINFKYFEESDQEYADDLQSLVDGVEFVREIYKRLEDDGVIAEQLSPKADEDLHAFVKNNAWGHHASCTCKIGPDDDADAVLDKDFQVRGAKNLRVVDASVFPRIPGLFILSSVYMISEKASDVIIGKYQPNGLRQIN
jgi:choline dehydrogenase